ncbi:hypothetical protein BWR17_14645 [Phaeobacter inhibens]|uniref:pentapeptide repeat-containing protein n=1 Tax=Phaeobacter inhibens TaxID=221822 RepID=UPI000971AD1A|nr:pentapeptide repeat-containing protein [Phaeobacter inhibens]APX16950.1 hypothetical protein BWR17_14645 [Phaeobacter inhibens]
MATTDTVSLTLPLTWHQLTLLLAAAGFTLLVLLTWLAISAPAQAAKERRWSSNGLLLGYSLCLLPVWTFLLFETCAALWMLTARLSPDAQSTDLRWHVLGFVGLVTATGGLAGAPLALMRVWANERQTRTAEQNHMTDRITKAVEQLGAEKTVKRLIGKESVERGIGITLSKTIATPKPVTVEVTEPNIEVRIGALLALQRISEDSVQFDNGRDHVRVMKIFCAYIRNNAPESEADEVADGRFIRVKNQHMVSRKDDLPEIGDTEVHGQVYDLPRPRSDIAVALHIIGQRNTAQIRHEERQSYRLDLSRSNLQRADLSEGNFSGVNFLETRMEGAYLNNADFSKANLTGAVLTRADLSETLLDYAKLSCTDFSHALLYSTLLKKCGFSFTRFEKTHIENSLFDVQLSPGAVNRIWIDSPNLMSVRFSGQLGMSLSGSLRKPNKNVSPKYSAVIFRNATVSSSDLNFFDPYRTFGDGSVTLTSGERPDHWIDETLDDFAFDAAVEAWGETYEEVPGGS